MGTYNPKLPTRSTGTDKYITFFVTRNRQPTLAHYRQPETGTNYSLGTVWQVGKNPTTGLEGDLWMLSMIIANQGYWVQVASGGVGPIIDITGDIGTIGGPDVTIYADQVDLNCGSTVWFYNTNGISTMNVTDAVNNTIIGKRVGCSTNAGHKNTALGQETLTALAGGQENVLIGYKAGNVISSQGFNVGIGSQALLNNDESFNTAVGYAAMTNSSAANNCIAVGNQAGVGWGTDESFNIAIGNNGDTGEDNTIRIGTQYDSGAFQNRCFIAGIVGVTVSNQQLVTIDSTTGQLGVTTESGLGQTITGNSGGPIAPSAGNWNIVGDGSITTIGSGSTLTIELTGLTSHNVLVGAGTTTITKVAPNATTGIPFISKGVAADPDYGTAVVAGGGTGAVSFTAYAPVCGGTTTTNPLESADTGITNVGYVLTSTGAASLPTWQAAGSGVLVKQGRAISTTAASTAKHITITTAPTTSNCDLCISQSYTPTNASNILVFQFSAPFTISSQGPPIFALFSGSTFLAGYTAAFNGGLDDSGTMNFTFYATAGTTSPTTYAVYFAVVGSGGTQLRTLQDNSGTALFGGVGGSSTTFTITEMTP